MSSNTKVAAGNIQRVSAWRYGKLVGVIGDLSSETSLHMANILSLYGYPQISYGATHPNLANKNLYPSFFRTLHNDHIHIKAVVKLLKHFGWTWIGMIMSDDIYGEIQSQELKQMAALNGICIEFSLKTTPDEEFDQLKLSPDIHTVIQEHPEITEIFRERRTKRKTLFMRMFFFIHVINMLGERTLIILARLKKITHILAYVQNGFQTRQRGGFYCPGELLDPLTRRLTHCAWKLSDYLVLDQNMRNYYYRNIDYPYLCLRCSTTGGLDHRLSNFVSHGDIGHTRVSHLKKLVAVTPFHRFRLCGLPNARKNDSDVAYFLRRLHFKDPTGEDVYFDENGEMPTVYDIENCIILPNGQIMTNSVGKLNICHNFKPTDRRTHCSDYAHRIPLSRCSEDCPPGYRQVPRESIHICCFSCAPCPDGEISNQTEAQAALGNETDKISCQKCPDDKWPNEGKDKCINKLTEFLSIRNDPIALALSIVSILFSITASINLCIFILFRDTPIVKANNQNLSFILLVSIILSFLFVFLFLGRPVDIICMLRQTSFGIIFSVAVSSLLAKTIMVCIAFKATKPGNSWRKWMGIKIPNCVVFICSFTMVMICISWLSVSPPFQEMNTHSYPGKIIIQCNEGSVIAFYTVLGYMGFLAVVSFIVAFLVRKLPDSFNEAKYITFSMLVFCNVWITFIPAYMSVMGKNTVIVEIFAIIASSAGILICIFFPKCYIILFKPQLNSKGCVMMSKRNVPRRNDKKSDVRFPLCSKYNTTALPQPSADQAFAGGNGEVSSLGEEESWITDINIYLITSQWKTVFTQIHMVPICNNVENLQVALIPIQNTQPIPKHTRCLLEVIPTWGILGTHLLAFPTDPDVLDQHSENDQNSDRTLTPSYTTYISVSNFSLHPPQATTYSPCLPSHIRQLTLVKWKNPKAPPVRNGSLKKTQLKLWRRFKPPSPTYNHSTKRKKGLGSSSEALRVSKPGIRIKGIK
ncbi:vomeronasal type-2 receptor 26-like [Pelobates cultripes]|uniref:Vomeronasal type-2 receptor 26-like n=1 Tax=Pelobates cultripes TaxID=61616 RepID=A0AAD1WCM5_PELCU|nr:vomeronasal type-2 receptor 26-like [Pelobates cultripes]